MGTSSIVVGSIGAIARQSGRSIAETFMNCDHIVIVDTSGSMMAQDARGNKTRYDVACEELIRLQKSLPGKIAVLSFSDQVQFCPSGIPHNYMSNTLMAGALKFAKVADVPGITFYLISDGYPDSPGEALEVARKYKNKINTIYVGPEGDQTAIAFLASLAAATGAKSASGSVNELQTTVETLMLHT